ncbi:MAG: alpha/beta hydrolase family protein [Planctomycetota bacterium]
MSIDYDLPVAPDRVIRGTIELPPEDRRPAPVVLFCHGFKGFKDWGGWPWLTRGRAEEGFLVNRFNFSLAGVGACLDRHDEPEKFARNTYGAELEDLHALIEARDRWGVPAGTMGEGLGIVGHSRGGMVSLLFAAEEPAVEALVTISSPGQSDRFPEELKVEWRARGVHEVVNARTGEVLPMDVSILDDYEENRERYDVGRAVTARHVPTLILHGDEDESVEVVEAQLLHGAIPHDRKELRVLEGTGHTLGTVQPFAGATPHLEEALHHASRWLSEHLTR